MGAMRQKYMRGQVKYGVHLEFIFDGPSTTKSVDFNQNILELYIFKIILNFETTILYLPDYKFWSIGLTLYVAVTQVTIGK